MTPTDEMKAAVERLEACPFDDGSGRHKVRLDTRRGRAGSACPSQWLREHVECRCGARGPEFKRPGMAIAAWNTRSNHLPRPVDEEEGKLKRLSPAALSAAYADLKTRPTPSGDGMPQENAIGAAEREVGQFVYRRIEALMDAKAGTPEGAELTYLAEIVSDVEEYGATGSEPQQRAPFQTPSGDGLVEALRPFAELEETIERLRAYQTKHGLVGDIEDFRAWCVRKAETEGDLEIGAGFSLDPPEARQALAHHTPVCRDSEEGGEA